MRRHNFRKLKIWQEAMDLIEEKLFLKLENRFVSVQSKVSNFIDKDI